MKITVNLPVAFDGCGLPTNGMELIKCIFDTIKQAPKEYMDRVEFDIEASMSYGYPVLEVSADYQREEAEQEVRNREKRAQLMACSEEQNERRKLAELKAKYGDD